MFSKEQKEFVIKYANERYEQGYREGYSSGVVFATLTSMVIIVGVELYKSIKRN